MTREVGQFDESFGAEAIRKDTGAENQTVEASETINTAALTAEQLGEMLCRISAIHIGSGEEILVVLDAKNWQALMDTHGLVITRRVG